MNAPLRGDTEETMKLTKKLLLASAALCAASLGFMACDNEDDPEGAITGSNNDYEVFYDNTNGYGTDKDDKDQDLSGVYRAWNRTTNKHLGALTKITLNKGCENAGVMGFAWDLQDTDKDDGSEAFNVVGIRHYNGVVQAYLSRYYNITNKNANNFGAESNAVQDPASDRAVGSNPVEWDISKTFKTVSGVTADADGNYQVWIDVTIKPTAEELNKSESVLSGSNGFGQKATRDTDEFKNADIGAWVVAVYTADPATNSTVTPALCWAIRAGKDGFASGYDSTNYTTSSAQKKQAVYANIYKGHVLSGKWHYGPTYHLANVAPVDGE
ncbi:MAG: hypothetical protein K2K67_03860 [Treponemataceae bacterium]|nr:hypothetical protein [Treponemataceae bacterium]